MINLAVIGKWSDCFKGHAGSLKERHAPLNLMKANESSQTQVTKAK